MASEEASVESLVVELTEKMTVLQAKLLQVKSGAVPQGFSSHLRTIAVKANEAVISYAEPAEDNLICDALGRGSLCQIRYYFLETTRKLIYIDTNGTIQLMTNGDGTTNPVIKEVSFFAKGDRTRTVRIYASNGYLLQYEGGGAPTTAVISKESVTNHKSWFFRDQRQGFDPHFFLRPFTDENVCIRGTEDEESPLEVTTRCTVRNLMFQGPMNY